MASLEMQLFDRLEKGVRLNTLAGNQWNESRLALFLRYLQHLGLVRQENGEWQMTPSFAREWANAKSLAPFIAWETCLKSGWVTASEIVDAMKQGPRKFDQMGFRGNEQVLYMKAMYGDSIRPIGLQLRRLLMGKETLRILEAGRSPGILLEQLLKFHQISQGTILIFPELLEITQSRLKPLLQTEKIKLSSIHELEPTEPYDLICLMNTIHYWNPQEARQYFTRFRKLLDTGGKLAIIDLFIGENKQFGNSVLLDWITHGGCYWLEAGEVMEQLIHAGFQDPKWRTLPGSEWEWILAE